MAEQGDPELTSSHTQNYNYLQSTTDEKDWWKKIIYNYRHKQGTTKWVGRAETQYSKGPYT